MDSIQFKKAIESVSDHIIHYNDTIHTRRVMSNVKPGYLKKLLPHLPPEDGEEWDRIQSDIEEKIMPGMTHWNSPKFMAYFPAPTSYPSMLGELYSSALAVSAFNWECAPAVTELEIIVMDWLVEMLNLPSCYLSSGNGGGVIHGTTSEAILSIMVAARERYLNANIAHLLGHEKDKVIAHRRLRMVAIGSEAAHSCTQKAAMILGISYRSVPVDINDQYSMTGAVLASTLSQCHQEGLEPFFLVATLGTTATCAVDRFDEIAQVIRGHQIWMHVDAAYAGAALVCEEYQHLTRHLAEFDSFSFSMSKWLLTNIDAVCCFIKNRHCLTDAMSITPAYLRNDASDSGEVVDFRDWSVPLSRRFRALKIWFVIRTYGVNGFKSYIRNHIKLGHLFASLIESRPDLFKIVTVPAYALTVISIVPRTPPILRKFLGVKAKEAKTAEGLGIKDSFQEGEGPRSNGQALVDGGPKLNGVHSSNDQPVNGNDVSKRVVKSKSATIADGHSQLNAQSNLTSSGSTRRRSKSLAYGSDHAIRNSVHAASTPGTKMPSNRDPCSIRDIIAEQILLPEGQLIAKGNHTSGEGSSNGTHSESESETDSAFASGSSAMSRATSDTSITNVQASIEEASGKEHNPTANHLPLNTSGKGDAKPVSCDDCAEDWITEYGNMITKEVYDLINRRGEIMLTSTVIGGSFVIRVNGANPNTDEKHLRNAFAILVQTAEDVLRLT